MKTFALLNFEHKNDVIIIINFTELLVAKSLTMMVT